MKTYILKWIDAYNSENWSISKLKKHFPITNYILANDGWYDCEHSKKIMASNIEELKVKINNYLDNVIMRDIDIFSVFYNNKQILTEEDF